MPHPLSAPSPIGPPRGTGWLRAAALRSEGNVFAFNDGASQHSITLRYIHYREHTMGICVSKSKSGGDYHHGNQTDHPAASSAGAKASSLATRPPSLYGLENLPKRVRSKAIALEDAVRNASPASLTPEMAAYADAVLRVAETGGAHVEILKHDARNINTLADTYNAAHPDLKLRCLGSPAAFLESLHSSNEPAWRAIFPLRHGGNHQVAVDIRTHPNGKKTLLLLEPLVSRKWNQEERQHDFIAGLTPLLENIGTPSNNCKVAVIDVEAQKSKIGCVIFCLDFALSAYRKSDFFNGLHARLHDTGRCVAGPKSQVLQGMEFIDGTRTLPSIFYKHANSRATIKKVIGHQPGLRKENVSTHPSAPHETLLDRVRNFRITRGELSYSVSSEASRMRKIRKTIEDLCDDPTSKPDRELSVGPRS